MAKVIKCGGVIFNEDKKKILVVHQVNKGVPAKWGCPKGHRNKNEMYHRCANREMYEELGLKIKTDERDIKIKVGNTIYFPYILSNMKDDMEPIDKNEICEIKLVDIDNINNYEMNYELKKILENIDIFRDKAVRTYLYQ